MFHKAGHKWYLDAGSDTHILGKYLHVGHFCLALPRKDKTLIFGIWILELASQITKFQSIIRGLLYKFQRARSNRVYTFLE